MSFETTTPLFNPPSIALLRAVSAPDDLTGIAHSLPIILSCVIAAAELWPNEPLKKWVEVTEEMQRRFSAAKSLTDGVTLHFFNKPDSLPKQYEQLINWRPPTLKAGPAYEAHALLGRAIVQAATRKQVLPTELLNGFQTLNFARQGKGRRSKDWELLLEASFADSKDLRVISQPLPNGHNREFLKNAGLRMG